MNVYFRVKYGQICQEEAGDMKELKEVDSLKYDVGHADSGKDSLFGK